MVYENSNPFTLIEPGGCLDVKKAIYKKQKDGSYMLQELIGLRTIIIRSN